MTVRYEVVDRVAVVTIDRPERRNAVDLDTARELGEAWRRFDADDEADVGILTGAAGAFSAGADLKAFDLEDHPDGFLGFTRMEVAKPTIAAVEGACVAGGLEMALWCDLRVAGRSAVFGCFERRFGVPLVDGGTQRLPRIVGLGRALDLILTGRSVHADEAERIGLVTRVVDDGAALASAIHLARAIGSHPQETVRTDRAAVYGGIGRPLEEGMERERALGSEVLDVAARGAARFAAGLGRGGAPVEPEAPARETSGEQTAPDEPRPIPAEEAVPPEGEGTGLAFGSEEAHLAVPAAGHGRGVLVVGGEGRVPGSRARSAADSLAGMGYVALAVGPGDPARPDLADALLGDALDVLAARDETVGDRLGVVGLGAGGAAARWVSARDPRLVACVTFGRLDVPAGMEPDFREAGCAYLGHAGTRESEDVGDRAVRLEMRLRELGLDATVHLYRDAGAGFEDPSSPAHREELADLAWERTRLFLDRHL